VGGSDASMARANRLNTFVLCSKVRTRIRSLLAEVTGVL
jgi:hypothetical protein